MKWAVSTAGLAGRQLEPLLSSIAAAGFRNIEFLCMRRTPPGNCWRDTWRVRKALQDAGLSAASVHTSGDGWNNADADAATRRASVEAALEGFDFAAEIGATMVVCHPIDPFSPVTAANHSAYRLRARESLQVFAERAASHGLRMAVENMPSRGKPLPGRHVADLLELTAGLGDHVGICLDTGHCLANDLDPASEAAAGGRYILNAHAHDRTGPQQRHLLPGRGTINWASFMATLRAASSGSLCTFEVIVPEGQTEEFLREMACFRRNWDMGHDPV